MDFLIQICSTKYFFKFLNFYLFFFRALLLFELLFNAQLFKPKLGKFTLTVPVHVRKYSPSHSISIQNKFSRPIMPAIRGKHQNRNKLHHKINTIQIHTIITIITYKLFTSINNISPPRDLMNHKSTI